MRLDSKEIIQKFAVGLVNYTLVDGLFWTLDIPIEDKRKVLVYMLDKLGYYFEEYWKEGGHLLSPFGENIIWLSTYGSEWDMFEIKGIREELKNRWFMDSDIRYTPLNKKKKDFLQNFLKMLVHFCYRNGVIEDIHSIRPALTDLKMKEINKDIMNRMSLFWSEFTFGNMQIAFSLIDVYTFNIDEYPMYSRERGLIGV